MIKEEVVLSLIDTQSKYIKLLEKGYSEIIGLVYLHGYRCNDYDVENGKELRAKIKELKDSL